MTSEAKSPAKRRRKPARATPKPKAAPHVGGGPKVGEAEVSLVVKPGRKGKGDGPEGEYWEVQLGGQRAGEVFLNVIDEPPLGRHASLQIFLSKIQQGKGIGRVAYRLAAEASVHATIHLHMRKSNPASRIAAEAAGFVDVTPPGVSQLILCRSRQGG